MNLQADVQNAMTAYIRTKKAHVERNNGPTDLHPQLLVFIDGTLFTATIPDRDFVEAAAHAIEQNEGRQADEVIFCGDAWIRSAEDTPEERARIRLDPPRHGQFEAEFKAGDMSVTEGLDCTGIDRNGKLVMIVVGYYYDDRGRVKFRLPRISSDLGQPGGDELEGPVVEALRRVMER